MITENDDFQTADRLEREGSAFYEQGRMNEALAAFADASEIFDMLRAEHPADEELSYRSASAHNNTAAANLALGRFEDSREDFMKAATVFGFLWEQNQTRPEFGNDLAATLNNIGKLISHSDKPEAAIRLYSESLRIRKEVRAKHPEDVPRLAAVLQTTENLAELYEKLGMTDKVNSVLKRAATLRVLLKTLAGGGTGHS